jgi:hypothetical protein
MKRRNQNSGPHRPRWPVKVRPCPQCGGRPFSWGPDGLPQRRCWTCGHLWLAAELAEQYAGVTGI